MDRSIYDSLKPHPDYDFVNDQKVCYQMKSLDVDNIVTQYCILNYEPEVGAFMLINYTDDSYTTIVPPVIEGELGLQQADFLFEVGIELLESVE